VTNTRKSSSSESREPSPVTWLETDKNPGLNVDDGLDDTFGLFAPVRAAAGDDDRAQKAEYRHWLVRKYDWADFGSDDDRTDFALIREGELGFCRYATAEEISGRQVGSGEDAVAVVLAAATPDGGITVKRSFWAGPPEKAETATWLYRPRPGAFWPDDLESAGFRRL